MEAKHRAGRLVWALTLALIALTSGPPTIATARSSDKPAYSERGKASYYGASLHGRKMASGKHFDRHKLTAAHRDLPFGSKAVVTNLENGKKVEVEISDRGPYANGRVIDLSEAAAARIGITRRDGTALVLIVASTR